MNVKKQTQYFEIKKNNILELELLSIQANKCENVWGENSMYFLNK